MKKKFIKFCEFMGIDPKSETATLAWKKWQLGAKEAES